MDMDLERLGEKMNASSLFWGNFKDGSYLDGRTEAPRWMAVYWINSAQNNGGLV
jgi:hypothetical protein